MIINTVSLEELADGEFKRQFDDELERIVENIGDERTSPMAKRTMTIKVVFEPNKDRTFARTTVEVSSKLAPSESLETGITIGTVNGKPKVSEYVVRQEVLDFNAKD